MVTNTIYQSVITSNSAADLSRIEILSTDRAVLNSTFQGIFVTAIFSKIYDFEKGQSLSRNGILILNIIRIFTINWNT